MGHEEVTEQQTQELLSRYDTDQSGFIEWKEFLAMMKLVKQKETGVLIPYSAEEVSAFARFIN